jgi:hypothetical protein
MRQMTSPAFLKITEAAELTSYFQFFQSSDSTQLTGSVKNLLNHAFRDLNMTLKLILITVKPAVVAAIFREQHFQQLSDSPVQMVFEYSNAWANDHEKSEAAPEKQNRLL